MRGTKSRLCSDGKDSSPEEITSTFGDTALNEIARKLEEVEEVEEKEDAVVVEKVDEAVVEEEDEALGGEETAISFKGFLDFGKLLSKIRPFFCRKNEYKPYRMKVKQE